MGVCGKNPEVAAMQDLLIYVTKGLAAVCVQLREEGKEVCRDTNHMVTLNLFTTITNANFDNESIIKRIKDTLARKEELLGRVENKEALPEASRWNGSEDEFETKSKGVGVLATENEDIRSLRELIVYGLKGLAAYSKHANALMNDDEEVDVSWS